MRNNDYVRMVFGIKRFGKKPKKPEMADKHKVDHRRGEDKFAEVAKAFEEKFGKPEPPPTEDEMRIGYGIEKQEAGQPVFPESQEQKPTPSPKRTYHKKDENFGWKWLATSMATAGAAGIIIGHLGHGLFEPEPLPIEPVLKKIVSAEYYQKEKQIIFKDEDGKEYVLPKNFYDKENRIVSFGEKPGLEGEVEDGIPVEKKPKEPVASKPGGSY